MRWFEVTVHTSQEAVELVAHAFHELGAGGVAIEDPEVLSREWDTKYGELYHLSREDYPADGVLVKGYIPETAGIEAVCAGMEEALADLAGFGLDVGAASVVSAEVFEEDWAHAWKQYYKPVRVSRRLLVKPSWEDLPAEAGVTEASGGWESGGQASDSLLVIEMDPGMAFGTGTHPTTVLCMQALDDYIGAGSGTAPSSDSAERLTSPRVLDVGTGSGILAIAAAKLGAQQVLAIDLDPVAVESAGLNVSLNGVAGQVEVRQGDLLGSLDDDGWRGSADLVVANILAEIIVTFVADVLEALRLGGLYITSGIIGGKAALVREALLTAGFELVEERVDGDWAALIARRPM